MTDDPIDLKHHHGAVSVPDLEASIEWYKRVLDFDVEKRFPIPTVPAKAAMLKRGNLRFEIFEAEGAVPLPDDRRMPDRDMRTHGNKHTAFAVKDARATAERLRARGADIAFVVDMKHGAAVFVRDNAGNLIEFVQEPSLWD